MAEGGTKLDQKEDSVSMESGYGTLTSLSHSGSLESTTSFQYGQTPEFVNTLPERCNCNICKHVAKAPTQSECGHLFCKSCIEEYFATNPGTTVCPTPDDKDCQNVTKKGLCLDNGVLRELGKQMVYCSNKSIGCPETMTWSKLRQHQAVCTYTNNGTQGNRTEEIVDDLNSTSTTQLQLMAPADRMEELSQRILKLETRDFEASISMEENSQRILQLETRRFDGTLVWDIDDYLQKKQQATNGQILSCNSQPFYTGRCGYKMCVRLYLNGDGARLGTHLSMFFVVMKGDYDALLPWPFKQKITMKLLNQGFGPPLVENFIPIPSSSSFQQPVAEMNEAFGPFAIPQSLVQTSSYLKDDVLFVKVLVEKYNYT